jgi:starch-binding outer membrane protein, SusD/RagB family
MKKVISAIFILIIIGISACHDLEVENMNETSLKNFAGNLDVAKTLAGASFKTFHNAMHDYNSPAPSMGVMADQSTCSFGFQAVNDLSSEPRHGFYNFPSYAYYPAVDVFWKNCYESISLANIVLSIAQETENKLNDLEIEMLKAWGYFVSGTAHGYLGLAFDKAHIVTGNSDVDSLGYTHWENVIDFSIESLDKAIEIADNSSFKIPGEWMGGEIYTSKELAELANSYAARILTYSSRNKLNNENMNWNRVLKYTSRGIRKDLAPLIGDVYDFYDMHLVYAIYPGWTRIDHRIINLMDPDYPSYWPRDGKSWNTTDGQDPGAAYSIDARLETDFEYLAENNFPPARGYYHFSHYRHKRYDDFMAEVWYGNKHHPSFLVWENELLKAEANVRLGNTTEALSVLNDPNGARKQRGKLPDITSLNPDQILWNIFYERDIELINSGIGIGYFDMRRRDMLQRGTILHFPVPAGELIKTRDDIYTFGKLRSSRSANLSIINGGEPDGVNVSLGSWTGRDGVTVPPGIIG